MLRIEQGVITFGILGIAVLGIVNVLARNLLGGSLAFAEEVNQALMIWITFGGLGLAARRARHIRMAAFYDQLRGRARKAAWVGIVGGTSALLAVLSWLAFRYVAQTYSLGGVSPALRVPLWLTYSIAPVGLALGSLEYFLTLLRNLRNEGIHASVDLEEADTNVEVAT